MHFPLSPSESPIKGEEGEGERGWKKKLLYKLPIWKFHKHSGHRLLLRRRVEPLKKSQSIYFPFKFSSFIAVSRTRGTDHGVGLNSTPTLSIWIKTMSTTSLQYEFCFKIKFKILLLCHDVVCFKLYVTWPFLLCSNLWYNMIWRNVNDKTFYDNEIYYDVYNDEVIHV